MSQFLTIYQQLYNHFGPRHWWPADSPFEVVVGAILTQNTNWKNVEKAIFNLKQTDALNADKILACSSGKLEALIRPSGFFRQKSERLKLFCQHLHDNHSGDLGAWLKQDLEKVRAELLGLKGIGPETADSILLYAGQRPSFVIDAYTNRIFSRLGLLPEKPKYESTRQMFMDELPPEVQLYNEYHALIVIHAKEFCRKKPLCANCPLKPLCQFTGKTA